MFSYIYIDYVIGVLLIKLNVQCNNNKHNLWDIIIKCLYSFCL